MSYKQAVILTGVLIFDSPLKLIGASTGIWITFLDRYISGKKDGECFDSDIHRCYNIFK